MASKICTNCGESNSENAFICVQCSSTLKDSLVLGIPDALKTIEKKEEKRICSHCNEEVGIDDIKCRYCGTVFIQKSKKDYYIPKVDSDSNFVSATILLYIATLFIPIVGLIVGGMFAFNDDYEKQIIGKGLLIFGLIMILVDILVYTLIL